MQTRKNYKDEIKELERLYIQKQKTTKNRISPKVKKEISELKDIVKPEKEVISKVKPELIATISESRTEDEQQIREKATELFKMRERLINQKPNFDIIIDNPEILKKALLAIRKLRIEEINLYINKDGIHFFSMDPSSIGLIKETIPNKIFSKYNIEKEGSIMFNVDDLLRTLNANNKNDRIELKFRPSDNMKDELEIIGKNQNNEVKYSTRNQILDTSKNNSREPIIVPSNVLSVEAKELKKILKSIKDEFIKFDIGKDNIAITNTRDSDEIKYRHIIPYNNPTNKTFAVSFNKKYIDNMLKEAGNNTIVTIEFKGEEPLKIKYTIGSDVNVEYMLAPYMID